MFLTQYININNYEILVGQNRKKVISTYELVKDNDYYKKAYFMIDRDLSDITGEYTPICDNVYVTEEYSIENSIFNDSISI